MPFSSDLLAFDDIPATVSPNLVKAIRRHVEQINATDGEPFTGLKSGETVVIRGRTLEGYEAIY